MAYFSIHNHSSYSNAKAGLDSINKVEEMIEYAHSIQLKGLVLSEHELLSSHIKMFNHYNKLKKQGKLREDFIVAAGNEIYLCHQENLEELKEAREAKDNTAQFYHFLLLAANREGYQSLRRLSSQAWIDSWRDGLVTRTPTFKNNLKKHIKQGDVIASTACIGGLVGQSIIKMRKASEENNSTETDKHKKILYEFIDFCIDVFGKDNFYIELQPSEHEEQNYVNRELVKLSAETGLKYVISTDGHYLKKEDRKYHKRYLLSQNMEREVDAFYDATFIMSEDEVIEYMSPYLSREEIQIGLDNTINIYNKIEMYDLSHDTIVPTPPIPEYKFKDILEPAYETHPYIHKFAKSEYKVDRFYLHLIQEGLLEKIVNKGTTKEYFHICLDRIETELKEVWEISEKLHERVSGYYVLVRDIIMECMWDKGDSIVGVARGSAGGFFTVYLLSIIQINPLTYNLPHFRHLTADRPELPDKELSSMLAMI